MKKAYYERPARARKGTKCYKCAWRHTGGDYLCDFATLAAPLTRGVGTLRKHAGVDTLRKYAGGIFLVSISAAMPL